MTTANIIFANIITPVQNVGITSLYCDVLPMLRVHVAQIIMAMYRYFKRKERNSDSLPYYNLGLPSAKIKTGNTLNFYKLSNILSANISGYTVNVLKQNLMFQQFYTIKISNTYTCTEYTYMIANTIQVMHEQMAYMHNTYI